MRSPLACAESVLLPSALIKPIVEAYDLGASPSCELLSKGLDTTYLLVTEEARFALRLYHARWWQNDEIQYELEALVHLSERRVPVARLVARRDGQLSTTLMAPEGPRQLVVSEFVDGDPFDPPRDSRHYGWTVAAMHAASEDFECHHPRRRLDVEGLLDASFLPVLPHLDPQSEASRYLLQLERRVRERVGQPGFIGLEHGFCHGDLNFANCRRSAPQTISVFDFECCGFGLRAYDLAVFRWTQRLLGEAPSVWDDFLAGYRERRSLDERDVAAIDVLMVLRQLWLIGHDALRTEVYSNGTHWRRTGRLRNLPFLQQLDREVFGT